MSIGQKQFNMWDHPRADWSDCGGAYSIASGFYWIDTPEGEEYWANVMTLLRKRERQAARRVVRNKNIAAP